MSIEDPYRICGTASAFVERSRALTALVDACAITVALEGESIILTLTPQGDVTSPTPAFNVHHGATPTSGYPFLASVLGVSIAAGATSCTLDAAGRPAPWHIVFQHADAFVARTLG